MSSAFVSIPPTSFPGCSRLDRDRLQEGSQQHIEHKKNWQSLATEGILESRFASGLPTPPETTAMTGTSINQHHPNNLVHQNYYTSKFSHPASSVKGSEARNYPHNGEGRTYDISSTAYQPPLWSASRENEVNQTTKKVPASDSTIAPYLQIPSSINDSKGSLAEFAAEVGPNLSQCYQSLANTVKVTCLFWFESAATLQRAEEPPSLNVGTVKQLAPDALPSMGFLKWVTTILTTTQVTQNVILLALLFIHRLKKFNPGVSGKKGSEYRLLTIALMLGNKCESEVKFKFE